MWSQGQLCSINLEFSSIVIGKINKLSGRFSGPGSVELVI